MRCVVVLFVCAFVSSEDVSGNISSNSTCGGIFPNEEEIVLSPDYPEGYSTNLDCFYVFKGPPCATYFNFRFLDFNLESSMGCTRDRLEIEDQDALCGSFSGMKSYFAENGILQARFISNEENSARGFKILVTRLPCGVNSETTTLDTNLAVDVTPDISTTISPKVLPQGPTLASCCANLYNSKHFFLTSPGFPDASRSADCTYTISKANANICRLRIHFLYFWVGDASCKEFLQIDGKYICGCRIGLKLISPFAPGTQVKVLHFRNANPSGGFVVEVVQDECPKRLAPKFYSYNDQVNRVVWPEDHIVERAVLVKDNEEVIRREGPSRNVYFFASRNDYDIFGKRPREVEETTYVETSGIRGLLPDGYDNYKCRMWGGIQWAMLAKEISWREVPECKVTKPITRQCEQASFVAGYVQSPGYPYYYPGNLNLCYRFLRLPGYCAVRVTFADFHLENSFQCWKDSLSFGGRFRYCGRRLHKSVLTFNLRSNPIQEMYFITDSYSCGHGFRALYEQIPCDNTGMPINPPVPTPRPPSQALCNRDIRDNVFVLEVYGYHRPRCVINVFKSNPGVCRLSVALLDFNLVCGVEHLLIENRRYCGPMSGQILNFNFNYQLSMVYERSTSNPSVSGLRFRLEGKQISTGCEPYEFPEVPAQRLAHPNRRLGADFPGNESDVLHDKELCGVVFNATEGGDADSICSFLMKRDNSTDCVEISPKVIYVPYNFTTTDDLIEVLHLGEFDLENVDLKEISCDELAPTKSVL